MQAGRFYCGLIWTICWLLQDATTEYVNLSHDGPVVLGGTITFKADLYKVNNKRPSGTYYYKWEDNGLYPQNYTSESTTNTTTYWTISYPRETNYVGLYEVQVTVYERYYIVWRDITSRRIGFEITRFLNGNITMTQLNKTVEGVYVSSAAETQLTINMRKGDYDFLQQKATSVVTYLFVDCKYYGHTYNYSFRYNFTNPNESHVIETLIIASFDLPANKTIPPTNTTVLSTTVMPNITTSSINSSVTTIAPVTPTSIPDLNATTLLPMIITESNISATDSDKNSIPYICLNSTIIPSDPNKTYGHFQRQINVRAPIRNITIEGTNWIQPWDMLSLNVTCRGSGPFYKCLQFHRGKYNVTGNETCENGERLHTCNFSIIHYFLEPSVNTILVILTNDVSKQISPLTINIYKATTKPQLSVIVVPVSCTLVAVVLIVFGVAYYIQSRARFTIEVADFDFGQNNPEMEYKTFMERLRDSFNNAGYKPLSNPQTLQ